jgi:hypothetical protein
MNTINLLICIAIAIVITLDVVIIIMLHYKTIDIMDYIFRYHNINDEYLKKIIQEIRHKQPEDCINVKYEKVNFVRDKKTGRFIRGNK